MADKKTVGKEKSKGKEEKELSWIEKNILGVAPEEAKKKRTGK
ncbi:MAG: hypothetical protein ACP5E4_01115 [Candidatus Aenigmatarchaeota archaeon]